MNYIPAEKLIERLEDMKRAEYENCGGVNSKTGVLQEVQELITSLQQEVPDKDTIIRICKLHKVWSITAPWENIEDFVITNWNSKNIV